MSDTSAPVYNPATPVQPHAFDAKWSAPSSTAQRIEAGRRLRRSAPRETLGALSSYTRDPLGILDEQNAGRLQELVPLRAERMSQSAFTFYRGTAAIMAADLAADAHSGIVLPACGDAHLSNFGFYASPQRTLVFDLNDFDEAAWAPWEWDLKRLLASFVVAGEATSRDEAAVRAAVLGAVQAYATALRSATDLTPVQRYYTHLDAEGGVGTLPSATQRVLGRAVKQARKRTGERAAKKLTAPDEQGRLRFSLAPPTMTPVSPEIDKQVHRLIRRYLETASTDIQQLVRSYVVSDIVRRVVGVGSVGTRCALTLLQDGDGHALILQAKQANRSVLEQYGGIPQPRAFVDGIAQHGEGSRVVALQRVLQAVSDPFLGYLQADGDDFYVRQFHDMKGGIEAEELDDASFRVYAQACAITLARAHSQSPLSAMVSGYIGGGRRLGEILLEWSYAYTARANDDYAAFIAAQTARG